MSKDRYRPNPSIGFSAEMSTPARRAQKDAAIDFELAKNGLINLQGTINVQDCLNKPRIKIENVDPVREITREITEEVGISLDVLEIFAEEQRKASGSIHALLDNEYPKSNGLAPKSIVADDYSEDSRP